ncbi:LysE/ArgO family amino acid transporter [Shimia marina]|uniref:Arginine exporter protein ArgO n=1 Tax=Shimia marina TaxID=321267 RepID=A0A0P1ER60_9RHOB|nr:LysE/ArgO family amino acid transporter [Shimia marina]CUH52792.1 Arginine exporter protein ArgO [Shimia marina]SFD87890.1 L-lysine exporter family protein LysE/ArgO [Shimia marina]
MAEMSILGPAIAGFALGFSLIMAIGAQNAFVLRQGLRGEYVLPLVLTCAISDAILITAGVAGFGVLIAANPALLDWVRYAGAAFLIVYGAMNFRAALKGGDALQDKGGTAGSLGAAVTTCLLLTWANPHVYLDTVVLLGGISAQYSPTWAFGLGAAVASFTFFFMLGFGAQLLRPLFTNPRAWQVLDVVVGATMWAIAAKLIWGM